MLISAPATLVLIAQNPRLGGAERSLYEWLLRQGERPHLICPSDGEWGALARKHGWEMTVIPMPEALQNWSWRGRDGRSGLNGQSGGALSGLARFASLAGLAVLPVYVWQISRILTRNDLKNLQVRTLGAKSHALGFLLLPWLRGRWQIDVRDFLRPKFLRTLYAMSARWGWAHIITNSRAVAADYAAASQRPGAVEVVYPRIALAHPPKPAQAASGPRIITHAAFFAPYKGQDRFLEFAAACLRGGLDAEFWLIGEVLYPAPEYAAHAARLRKRASAQDLAGKVHFLGRLASHEVIARLEQSHLLLHCTREPEPYGRILIEALLCGCEVVAHRGSGACEVTKVREALPAWVPKAAWTTLGTNSDVRGDYVALDGVEADVWVVAAGAAGEGVTLGAKVEPVL